MRLHKILALLHVTFLAVGCAVANAQSTDAPTVANLRRAMDTQKGLSFSIESTTQSDNAVKEFGFPNSKRVATVSRGGGCERLTHSVMDSAAIDSPMRYQSEYIIDPQGKVLTVQAAMSASGTQLPIGAAGNLQIIYSSPELAGKNSNIQNRKSTYNEFAEMGCLLNVYGRNLLEDYIKSSQITVSGTIVSSESKYGRISLELSEQNDWLPKRVEVVKDARSLVGETPMVDLFKIKKLPSSVVLPPSIKTESDISAKRMSWIYETTEFGRSNDGAWFPKQVLVTETTEFSDGRLNVSRTTISTEILNNPGDPCKPQAEIPVGYRVSIDGAAQLPYRWGTNGLEPGVPDLPTADGYEAMAEMGAPSNSKRITLVLVCLGILALVVGCVMFIRRKQV